MQARREGLAANARPFRYGFYPAVALGFLLFEQPEIWRAAAVAGWGALWPLAADWLTRRANARQSLQLHLLEVALTGFVFAAAALPPSLLAAVCIILVMSNALQGGLGQALRAIGAGVPLVAAGLAVSPPNALPSASSWFAGLLLLSYCVLVAHVAFARILAKHGERAAARALNERLRQYLPHTLAQRLAAAGQPRLERRWLVVVFADLAGFTTLVERLQMEELATALDSYLQCIAGATQDWGGVVSKVVGDGALLVFGEEGDRARDRLVADALGCCRTLAARLRTLTADWRRLGLPSAAQIKVGVASGYCSLGDWGGGGRLEYTVIGHPVNLASRLQDAASVGEVLLCERTSLLAQAALSPVIHRHLKGLGEVPFHKVEQFAEN